MKKSSLSSAALIGLVLTLTQVSFPALAQDAFLGKHVCTVQSTRMYEDSDSIVILNCTEFGKVEASTDGDYYDQHQQQGPGHRADRFFRRALANHRPVIINVELLNFSAGEAGSTDYYVISTSVSGANSIQLGDTKLLTPRE